MTLEVWINFNFPEEELRLLFFIYLFCTMHGRGSLTSTSLKYYLCSPPRGLASARPVRSPRDTYPFFGRSWNTGCIKPFPLLGEAESYRIFSWPYGTVSWDRDFNELVFQVSLPTLMSLDSCSGIQKLFV